MHEHPAVWGSLVGAVLGRGQNGLSWAVEVALVGVMDVPSCLSSILQGMGAREVHRVPTTGTRSG